MSTLDLAAKVQQFRTDSDIAHQIIHGDANTTVQTEGGPVRSLAKLIADNSFDFTAVNAELANHETRIQKLESGKEDLHNRICVIDPSGDYTVDSVVTAEIASVKWLVEITSPKNAPRFRRVFEVTAAHDGMFDTGNYPATEVDFTVFGKVSTGDQSVATGVEVVLENTGAGADFPRKMSLRVAGDIPVLVNVIRQEVVPIVDPAPYIAQLPPDTPVVTNFRLVTSTNPNGAWSLGLFDDNTDAVIATLADSWNLIHFDSNGVFQSAKSYDFTGDPVDNGNGLEMPDSANAAFEALKNDLNAIPDGDLIAFVNYGNTTAAEQYPITNSAMAEILTRFGASHEYVSKLAGLSGMMYVLLGKAGVGSRYGYPIADVFADGHTRYNDMLNIDNNNINQSKEYLQYATADALALRWTFSNGNFNETFIDIAPPTYGYHVVSQGLQSDGSWSGFNGIETDSFTTLFGDKFIGTGETWNLITFVNTGKIAKIQNFNLTGDVSAVADLTAAINGIAKDELFVLYSTGHSGTNIDNNTYPLLANAVWNNGGSPLWFPNEIGQSGAYILYSKGGAGFGAGKEYCQVGTGFIQQDFYIYNGEFNVLATSS